MELLEQIFSLQNMLIFGTRQPYMMMHEVKKEFTQKAVEKGIEPLHLSIYFGRKQYL